MHKEMMITVGTSLYHAAMWEPEGPLAEIRGYERWTTQQKFLASPAERDRDKTAGRLEGLLDSASEEETIARWVEVLHQPLKGEETIPPDRAMRYCGEVSTLVKLAADEGVSLREFLSAYEAITIPIDGEATEERSARRRSLIAGRHLVACLNEIAGREVCKELSIPGLASSNPDELGPALEELFKAAGKRSSSDLVDQLDLVVTGGFKVYGYLFARLLAWDGTRICYVHEGGQAVLVLDRHTLKTISPARRPRSYSLGFDRCA